MAVFCNFLSSLQFQKKIWYVNLFLLLFTIILAIYNESRSYTFSGIVGLAYIIFTNSSNTFKLKKAFFYAFVLISTLMIICVLFKLDSSYGRLFIYKISWTIFKDHFLFGIGIGNFGKFYGLYQAEYFNKLSFTEKEFLLADNTYFAFNDYWQFIVETGIIGALLIVFCLYTLIRISREACRQNKGNSICRLVVSLLMVILVAAAFTHVFEMPGARILVIIFILILLNYTIEGQIRKIIIILSLCLITISRPIVLFIENYEAYAEFENARKLSAIGNLRQALYVCDRIYPVLKEDIDFLTFYYEELNFSDLVHQREKVLRKLIFKKTHHKYYKDLGDLLVKCGEIDSAEHAYLTSINIAPNRFIPKKALFDLYFSVGDKKKATALGERILSMPVKINSEKIEEIKRSTFIGLGKLKRFK